VGLAEVSVVPGARALLEDELVKRGWTIAG
jgi:hypothetical protein